MFCKSGLWSVVTDAITGVCTQRWLRDGGFIVSGMRLSGNERELDSVGDCRDE